VRHKTAKYLAAGVREVWLLDPVAREVQVHRPGGSASDVGDEALRSEAVPGLVVVPSALFASPGGREGKR
jgi:Uma2 family endonuclease